MNDVKDKEKRLFFLLRNIVFEYILACLRKETYISHI